MDGLANNSIPLDHRSEISSVSVRNMISFVTGLKVLEGDGLPQQICRICLGQLVISYELKQTSLTSHAYFRRFLALPPTMRFTKDFTTVSAVCEVKPEPVVDQESGDEILYFCCLGESCAEHFPNEDHLVAHFDLVHKQTKELNEVVRTNDKFVCSICAGGFSDEVELLQHSLQVKRKPLRCDVCQFITYFQADLKLHSRSHGNLYRCVCGYSSNRKYSVQRHLGSMCCEEIYGKKASVEPIKIRRSGLEQAPTAMPLKRECDITDSELIALGFSVMYTRDLSKTYCCIKNCQDAAHDSEPQCIKHYEETHPVELESITVESSCGKAATTLKCGICRMSFQAGKYLQIHREDSFQPLFQCNTCGSDAFTRETALEHFERICTVKRFSCPCGFLTDDSSSLKAHFISKTCDRGLGLSDEETEEDPKNSEQEKTSKSPSPELQGNVKHYVCTYCCALKNSANSLKRHQQLEKDQALRQQLTFDVGREVEGVPGKMYACKWCNQPTNNVTHLVQCMVNVKEKLRCRRCLQKFVSKRRLHFHNMRGCRGRMVKARSLNCPYCERRFFHPNVLERHVTMDHPFDCSLRKLDPSRKFVCTTCGYRFRRKFCLERHMLVHNRKFKKNPIQWESVADGSA